MTSPRDLVTSASGPVGPLSGTDVDRLRRRTVRVLAAAQVLGGLAAGAVVTVGSPLAVRLSGSDVWAGYVTAAATLGAAFGSLGLAWVAGARGRRQSLSTGLVLAVAGAVAMVVAIVVESFGLLLVAGALLGVGGAGTLQARFAATDLSTAATRSRDLSFVVWTSTVGAVVGPNLVHLDVAVGRVTGLPDMANVFVLAGAGMLAALLVVQVGLRPEPLDVVRRQQGTGGRPTGGGRTTVPLRVAFTTLVAHPRAAGAVVGVVAVHAVMVAVMSVTPRHMEVHGATLTVVGVTVSLHLAAMYALSPLVGAWSDAVGPDRVLFAGLVVVVVAAGVCGVGRGDHVVVTVGLALLGVGWSAATVAGSSIVAGEVLGPERVAVQGLSDAVMSVAGAGGGALTGVALAHIGYGGLNAVSAGVVVAAGAAVLALLRRGATTIRPV